MQDQSNGTIQDQLEMLYAEREWLSQELGCCDAESIVDMVRSLEGQLCEIYRANEGRPAVEDVNTQQLLNYVHDLSQALDGLYAEKNITLQIEDDKPVLRATWKQITTTQTEGANK